MPLNASLFPVNKFRLIFVFTVLCAPSYAQVVTTDPAVPSPSQPVTITFDVTGSDFASKNLNDVWLWTWLDNPGGVVNAPTNVNPATAAQDAAKVTRSQSNPNIYSITITATTFFNKPADQISRVGVLLKGRDWSNGQTSDKFINFTNSFSVAFASPSLTEFFVNSGETVEIEVNTNENASIVLKAGEDVIASSSGNVTELSYTHNVTETDGSVTITAEANNGSETKTTSFTYIIRTATTEETRPAGIIDGINYADDQTKVTLSLWAPGKMSAYVRGDFNDWKIEPQYQMKKGGEHFWLEVSGLTPGTEYAFQYLVDETLKLADPYSDKILDPDDQYIPESTYPDLKPFPEKAKSDQWYFNRVSVLQTGQTSYDWQVTDFQKPAKETLVIYELLIRDFFEDGERNYQNLIDTLSYIKRLGVNAIELMPVMEFNGNDSWGYNPAFMFAPDKYYGTKNKLKEFIDKCHQNGIAVILDIVMNHQDLPNSYVLMDFDFINGKPKPDNKWFNTDAKHPFNVFFDMNHESEYTKKYLDTINHYWLNEYKVDGFRFDLSKGFTQVNNPNDVGAWSAYDASRIALLKRMADQIWEHFPDAYVILEHLSVNTEEKELAEYRADEGKGMMLWGKMTEPYTQNTMGFTTGSDISGVHHSSRGWTVTHLVSYMESHDEERMMYKNIQSGNSGQGYNTRNLSVALKRMEAAATIFYTVPGPKMLWQFGELGYDYSINHCQDGSNNENCRVSAKPVRWDYRDDEERYALYKHISDLNRLRSSYDIFTSGTTTLSGSDLGKQLMLKNVPYTDAPTQAADMNAVVVVNFDVIPKDVTTTFPHTGTWYDYYKGGIVKQISNVSTVIGLAPGEYKLFVDYPIESPFTNEPEEPVVSAEKAIDNNRLIYPNPTDNVFYVRNTQERTNQSVTIYSSNGDMFEPRKIAGHAYDISMLPSGLYVVNVKTASESYRIKLVKK